jgi:GrpB-like predicted nucleotidyltransferase (UPF0157 family)
MIVIDSYNPQWPQNFDVIRLSLEALVSPWAVRIDHIGSTAVPGLGAKDVIDVQVTVNALTPAIPDALTGAGYHFYEAYTHDHVPCGATEDPGQWEKFTFSQPEGARRANIHVRIDGRLNQTYALLFRDYLRAHPNSTRSIELIKRQLALRHAGDADAYYAIKDPVYDLVWEAALAWAERSGWRPG